MKKTQTYIAVIVALMIGLGFSPVIASAQSAVAKAIAGQSKNTEVEQIDINKADVEMLAEIPGIGPKTAEAIIAYRKDVGPFKSLEDLIEVKGIGPKKLETIRPFLQKI